MEPVRVGVRHERRLVEALDLVLFLLDAHLIPDNVVFPRLRPFRDRLLNLWPGNACLLLAIALVLVTVSGAAIPVRVVTQRPISA